MAKLNVCIRQKQPLECLDLVVRDRLETAAVSIGRSAIRRQEAEVSSIHSPPLCLAS
jgi:hypothetical protein